MPLLVCEQPLELKSWRRQALEGWDWAIGVLFIELR
jgi:hypothetical protein